MIGRKSIKAQSGLIFWAYHIGQLELVDELSGMTGELINQAKNDAELSQRAEDAKRKLALVFRCIN